MQIEIEDLCKGYGDVHVLDHLNLRAQALLGQVSLEDVYMYHFE